MICWSYGIYHHRYDMVIIIIYYHNIIITIKLLYIIIRLLLLLYIYHHILLPLYIFTIIDMIIIIYIYIYHHKTLSLLLPSHFICLLIGPLFPRQATPRCLRSQRPQVPQQELRQRQGGRRRRLWQTWRFLGGTRTSSKNGGRPNLEKLMDFARKRYERFNHDFSPWNNGGTHWVDHMKLTHG